MEVVKLKETRVVFADVPLDQLQTRLCAAVGAAANSMVASIDDDRALGFVAEALVRIAAAFTAEDIVRRTGALLPPAEDLDEAIGRFRAQAAFHVAETRMQSGGRA